MTTRQKQYILRQAMHKALDMVEAISEMQAIVCDENEKELLEQGVSNIKKDMDRINCILEDLQ